MFSGEFPSWITRFPEAERSWNAVLLSLDHQSDVGQVSISSDGQQVASSARLDPIRIWNMRTGHVKRIFKLGSSAHVISTVLSPDNQFLASGLWNGEVRLWDITLETEPRVFSHSSAVKKVAFSPDSKTFASTTQTGDLWVWNVNGSVSIPSLNLQLSWENQVVAFSPCGKHLMAEAPSYGLEIRSTRSWEVMHTLIGHSSSLCDVAFSACGGKVGSASCDGTVRVWDTENWELLHTLQHKEPVLSVAFSRHRDVVASGCWDNNIRLWSADTGQLQHVLTEHGGAPLSLE